VLDYFTIHFADGVKNFRYEGHRPVLQAVQKACNDRDIPLEKCRCTDATGKVLNIAPNLLQSDLPDRCILVGMVWLLC
jgi:hypothetical protein